MLLGDPVRAPLLLTTFSRLPNTLFGVFTREDTRVYNSLALWDTKSRALTNVYDKRWLIGFFEDNLARGVKSPVVNIQGVRIGVGICWESTFSDLGLNLVRDGAQILVYPSSNTFAGASTLPQLHLHVNTFRAVETGRYVVSASKSGPSAIISPGGQLVVKSP
jgi:apolipoprotein N-acyltransferase